MNIKAIDDFADEIISVHNKNITDVIFCLIEKDRDFMSKYMDLVHENGQDKVKQFIAKKVKETYQLSNAPSRNKEPLSTLIKSYQEFI
jgi:hypothetical protein